LSPPEPDTLVGRGPRALRGTSRWENESLPATAPSSKKDDPIDGKSKGKAKQPKTQMIQTAVMRAISSAFTAYAPPRLNIKIFTLPSSLWLLPWLLLDPACQIYGGLLVRIGTAGVLHLNVHKIETATF
jgi:hypothetical protein